MKRILLLASLACASLACALAASCGEKTYTYSFNSNGGTEISVIQKSGGEQFALPVPEREGYSFEGWYLSEDFSGEAVTEIVAESNATYYAKWEQMYAVTLDLNGGSLATTTVYLKSGANVYDALESYVPTKSGYEFGAWFDGDSELGRNTRMTSQGLSLVAKYKVAYSVEVWLQNTQCNGYEKSEEVLTGLAYSGTEVTAEYSVTGFEEVETADSVVTKTLGEVAAENVFKLYFNREEYQISFVANYPDGGESTVQTVTATYGLPVELPTNYTYAGYLLVGWSTSANGSLEYNVNNIDANLYNQEEAKEVTLDTLYPERSMALYGVWNKGYVDMFGGDDYIYYFDEANTSRDIYLDRGGVYFKGDYNPARNQFSFVDADDNTILEGKLNDNGTYAYFNELRAGYSAKLYVVGEGIQANTVLYFDAYDGVRYVVTDGENRNHISSGSYVIDENSLYVATFTEGEMAGQTITIMLGTTTQNNVKQNVFVVRNEEEYALGAIPRGVVYQGTLTYYSEYYTITLNGFGTAYFYTGSSYSSYTYKLSEDKSTITLTNSYGSVVGEAHFMTINNTLVYMFYNSDLDVEITNSDGSKLTLDGLYKATYQNGDTVLSGNYSASSSILGDYFITVTGENSTKYFLISSTTQGEVNGSTQSQTVYRFEEKSKGYQEYYYKNSSNIYYAPLIVLDDAEEGMAAIYGYNSTTSSYEKVSEGTYVIDSKTGLYLYTAQTYYDTEVAESVVGDLSTVHTILFQVGTYSSSSSSYPVNYWYYATFNGETEDATYYTEYTSTKGESLIFVGGFAVYSYEGTSYTGSYSSYSSNSNILVITITVNSNTAYLYVEVDDDTLTFETLTSAPYTAYCITKGGSVSSTQTITYDGKGGAVYTDGKVTYQGTVSETNTRTTFGTVIYQFKQTDGDFSFTMLNLYGSSYAYFTKYNEDYHGTYTSEKDGILELDGYGYMALYTDRNGQKQQGMYFFNTDSMLVMYVDDGYVIFDFSEDTFTVKGEEYGSYLVKKNQDYYDYYVMLDGYGKLLVYTIENGQSVYIDENGSYTVDGKVAVLQFTNGNEKITLKGEIGTVTISSTTYNVFTVGQEEVVQVYVNASDWSVMELDWVGNVVKYNSEGVKETGSYTLITDSYLYYINDDGTDATVFRYNTTNGTMSPLTVSSATSYYTQDLQALYFSRYGFVRYDSDLRFYIVENGQVVIYHQDFSSDKANQYGFVTENFGAFENVKEYNGKQYYLYNGIATVFNREEDTKNDYPVLLSSTDETKYALEELIFSLPNTSSFSTSATVVINGDNYSGTITRSVNDDGSVEMYLTIGYYRFDLVLTYSGLDENGETHSTYCVVGMRWIHTYTSYSYLYYYYLYYLYLGESYANAFQNGFGEISIVYDFDKEGNGGDPYIQASFGSYTSAYDVNGNLFTVDHASFEQNSNVYLANFTGSDGYEYSMYFTFSYMSYLSTYGYSLYGLIRYETLVDATSGLTVKIGRFIASEAGYSAGAIFSIELFDGEEAIEADTIRYIGNDLYYIVRTRDSETDEILSTTYYKLVLKQVEELPDEENDNVIKPYQSVTVTSFAVQTYYDADKQNYVDIDDSGVKLLCLNGTRYSVSDCTYDVQTNTYTVTLASGTQYTIQINDKVATISEVVAPENTDENQAA